MGLTAGEHLPRRRLQRETTLKRPALDALRDKARLRELEVVVVLSPDRLARNYVHQMVLMAQGLSDAQTLLRFSIAELKAAVVHALQLLGAVEAQCSLEDT